jgi:hypothetical protein
VTDGPRREPDDETAYWLSQPDIHLSIAAAEADIAAGNTFGEEDIRAEFRIARASERDVDAHAEAGRITVYGDGDALLTILTSSIGT